MRFYIFDSESPYPTARVVGAPESEIVRCGKVVTDDVPGEYKLLVLDNGYKWPDLMDSIDYCLFSEPVVKAFREAGMSGADFYFQALKSVESKRLAKRPYPGYYWADITKGVPAIPFQQDGITPCLIDSKTGFYDISKISTMHRWQFDFSEWNVEDLFFMSTVHTRFRFCSQRFKDLVEDKGFTNFKFRGNDPDNENDIRV